MIDKKGIVSVDETLFEKISSVIKGNTPQLAIFIPILTAMQVAVLNYYFYLESLGYYNYFGIDSKMMLPYDKMGFYDNITIVGVLIVYWIYAIFSVRMFLLKGNYMWKIVCLFLIPFFLSVILVKGYTGVFSIEEMVVFCMVFQWIMIFALGFCYVRSFHEDIIKNSEKQKTRKKNKKFKARWGNKEYGMFGLLIVLICCVFALAHGYYDSFTKAEMQRKFGIINVDDVQYVVIDSNIDKLVLQRCRVDSNILYFEKDTYYCIENNVLIQYESFGNVLPE